MRKPRKSGFAAAAGRQQPTQAQPTTATQPTAAKVIPAAQPQPAVQKRELAERAPELNKFVTARAVGKGEVQAVLLTPECCYGLFFIGYTV